jgi:3-deoxy-D-manno-octulosonate 8-phosphate phosphatase (KDO 8-P phosphatase)
VALITARRSAAVQSRARDLGLQHVHTGVKDKAATLRMLCASLGLSASETAHMGDDLPDLPALLLAGLSAAPANAHPWVAERVHWRARANGGHGAARELCDLILEAHGLRAAVLERFGAA